MQHYHTKQFGTQLNEMDNKLDVPERFLGHISTDLNTMENKKTTYNCLKFNNKNGRKITMFLVKSGQWGGLFSNHIQHNSSEVLLI